MPGHLSAPSTASIYTPLAQTKQEIRLIQIVPGSGPIELTLNTYELSEDLNYVALSYEWASGEDPMEISINGTAVFIFQNLWTALKNLREIQLNRSEDQVFGETAPEFWIDAVCINQADDAERGHQVAMMGRIFFRASRTIAWVGPERDDSAIAMRSLQERTTAYAARSAIRKFCDRSFFQRLWIVQEVLLARSLHFVCGQSTCPWDSLVRFWDRTNSFGVAGINSQWAQHQGTSTLSEQLVLAKKDLEDKSKERDGPMLLETLLESATDRHCTDFHDRVYAFLGLVERYATPIDLEIDYQTSPEEFMIRTESCMNPSSEELNSADYGPRLLRALASQVSIETQGRITWYWHITEILHYLSAHVLGRFERLLTLQDQDQSNLTLSIIRWIIAGDGVDLFSSSGEEPGEFTSGREPATGIRLEFSPPAESHLDNVHIVLVTSTYKHRTFSCELTFRNHVLWLTRPGGYSMTENESLECRKLLTTFNEDAKATIKMQDRLAAAQIDPDEDFDMGRGTRLPAEVHRAAFANLIAHRFHRMFRSRGQRPDRSARLDGFLRDTDPKSMSLVDFLSHSLFAKYRMEIVQERERHSCLQHANLCESIDINIRESIDANGISRTIKRRLVAVLYDDG